MKPMLAVEPKDLEALTYPLIASYKVDGIRCVITEDGPRTRSLKEVPNAHIAGMLEHLPAGLDGELVILDEAGHVDFRATTSGVMTRNGEPDFQYMVFDDFLNESVYEERARSLAVTLALKVPGSTWVRPLPTYRVDSAEGVKNLFARAIEEGFEGLILRDPNGAYKFGRSTVKEQGMLKVKPWKDAEAKIVDMVERYENANPQTTNELGYAQRSSHKANKIPRGDMGALVVEGEGWPNRFEVGTGFTDEDRKDFWDNKDSYIGKTVTFTYADVGGYDVPRHPVFKGIRAEEDMS